VLCGRELTGTTAVFAEGVIQAMGTDHEGAAYGCDKHLCTMCGKMISPAGGEYDARETECHESGDTFAAMGSIASDQSDSAQQSYDNGDGAMCAFF